MSLDLLDRRIMALQDQSERLGELLADPHPGLISWVIAVSNAVERLNDILDGKLDHALPQVPQS